MNKTKLIPFDLERWRAGDFKRVVTRKGKEVTQLTYFNTEIVYPIYGIVDNSLVSFTKDGFYKSNSEENDSNLMLEVEEKTLEGWVRVYKGRFGCSVFKTESEAIQYAENASDYITIMKITYPNE